MAIHCIHCGTELPDIAQFCQSCGKSPRGEAAAGAAPPGSAPPPDTSPAYLEAPTIRSSGPPAQDPLIPYPPPPPSYYSPAPVSAPGPVGAPYGTPLVQRKSRRGLWIALAVIAAVLVAGGGGVAYYVVNQSTASKAAQAGCDDVKNGNWQDFYNMFTANLQSQVGPEDQYVASAQQNTSNHGGVVSCTITALNQNGSTASGTAVVTYGDGTQETYDFTDVLGNGVWKIRQDVRRGG